VSRIAKIKSPNEDPESAGAALMAFNQVQLQWRIREATQLRYTPAQTRGLELRNNLSAVHQSRQWQGLAIGNLSGWVRAISRVAFLLDGTVNEESVARRCADAKISVPSAILVPVVKEMGAAAKAGAIDLSPAVFGEDIELTSAERQEHSIRYIDACDEPADQRRRRLARERSRRRRAERGAHDRERSVEAMMPWESLGISRRTYYRRLALNRHAPPSESLSRRKRERDETVPSPGERDETVPISPSSGATE
jgi:hypothetical protein